MTIALTSAPRVSRSAISRDEIARRLEEARSRTLLLIEPVSEADLLAQHDPLMGPILWDLGHIAHFEALWLDRNLDGRVEFVEMPGLYNPFEHPRRERGSLPLPSLASTLASMSEIRERVLERLVRVDLDSHDPLLRDGYVYQMVLQHEYQHNETMLQTLQLKSGAPYVPAVRRPLPSATRAINHFNAMILIELGDGWMGTDDRTTAYDNERPRHRVRPKSYWIDRAPVTNGDYLAFIEEGGYRRPELWTAEGQAWLRESNADSPKYWRREEGKWVRRSMDHVAPPEPLAPVIHVCYHEAEAFAKWVGKRLPSETEWEIAAAWNPSVALQRAYPWGEAEPNDQLANLDQLAFDVAPIGAYPGGVSPCGCAGMLGDVWEWTSTNFAGYPGFAAFPYPEYSEVFFGAEYKVLRGGSWATRAGAIRNTFRNWDYPTRRQIFSGFRCARDD
jgi:gamma-glutamyl hercynylcysteine S-oxide synthase